MRPNIACRSFLRTSSWSSTSRSAMVLNAVPSWPSSSLEVTATRVVEAALRQCAGAAREPQDRLDEPAAPERADEQHREQRHGDRDVELSLQRMAIANASRVGCSRITVQPRSAARRRRQGGRSRRSDTARDDPLLAASCSRAPDDGCDAGSRDAPPPRRVPVRQQLPDGVDDQGISRVADANIGRRSATVVRAAAADKPAAWASRQLTLIATVAVGRRASSSVKGEISARQSSGCPDRESHRRYAQSGWTPPAAPVVDSVSRWNSGKSGRSS